MTASLPKEEWGWLDTDECWWCNRGRKNRKHLFNEHTAWKEGNPHPVKEGWEALVDRPTRERADPSKKRNDSGCCVRKAKVKQSNTAFTEAVWKTMRLG